MADYDLGTARGRIELDASSLGRAVGAFTALGTGMVGFGVLAVGAFAAVASQAAGFEKILSAVGAVTGATGDQMDQLREKALTLATGSIFSADQIAGAFEDLGKAGITIPEILGGASDAVIHLAHAAGTELPGGVTQAAEVIANAMKTFNVSSDQAEHFADVLVAAAASSTISVDDMATSFRYAGPIANELGLSIDDLSTTLAILGDRGIKGSTAGTSLRGVLLSLTPTSDKARSTMKELGLITEDGTNKFYDLNGALKPMPEVMQILQDATKNLTEEQKVQALNSIFQRRAMNAAAILAEQGAAGFDHYADSIAKLNASDIAAKKLDNLSGDVTILKNSIQVLMIRAGEPLQAMIRGWVQHLTGVVKWISNLNPKIITLGIKILAAAGAISIIVGSGFLMLAMFIKMYKIAKDVAQGIKMIREAFTLLSSSLLTNPWFLLIAAIVLLGVAFYEAYQHSESFRNFIDGLVEKVKPVIDTIVKGWQGLVDTFNGAQVKDTGFLGFMERLGEAARKVYDFFTGDFIKGLQAFWDALNGQDTAGGGFIGFMVNAGDAARNFGVFLRDVVWPAVDGVAQALGGWQVVLAAVVVAIGLLTAPFTTVIALLILAYTQFDIVRTVIDGMIAVVIAIGTWLLWLGSEVIERLVSGFDWIKTYVWPILEAFGELVGAVVERILQFWGLIEPYVMTALGVVLAIIQGFIENAQIIWDAFGSHIWEYIQMVFELIKGIVQGALEIIHGIIDIVTGLISGDWGQVWDGIKEVFQGVWDEIKAYVQFAIDGVQLIISTALDGIKAVWDVIWNSLHDQLAIVFGLIISLVTDNIGMVTGILSGQLEWIKGLWNNAWDGVKDHFGEVMAGLSAVWDMTGGVVFSAMKGALDDVGGAFDTVIGWIQNLIDKIHSIPSLPDLNPLHHIPGLMAGTRNWIGGMAVVGENGPELLNLPKGSEVLNNMQSIAYARATRSAYTTADVGGGTGGNAFTLQMVFNGVKAEDIPVIKSAMNTDEVLGEIIKAARAGRR